jgi:hypothetical protein
MLPAPLFILAAPRLYSFARVFRRRVAHVNITGRGSTIRKVILLTIASAAQGPLRSAF